ncbi:CAP domain-containing protein [Rugamonas apoptosis]|uniref:CAP domain-containing protein n=1 Tax=Rugamonas apoptosis TaxID=2758570 RepID=A0A7W2F6T6_9BURK|nr:CAP domain-containing protein [Rugamonas apoptosis]MBA5686139.1 CAP domain-containing protein [Rugamonas apoptosis]
MRSHPRWQFPFAVLSLALALAACGGGGGGGGDGTSASPPASSSNLPAEPGAPALTGNAALDGFNWINFRRAQIGVAVLARNSKLELAAQGHADYQRINNTVTHVQTAGLPGFTGATLADRLANAGYVLVRPYAYGEIISATNSSSGFVLAEELVTAIYHRFVMFEPVFKEMGTGAALTSSGYSYFTCDMGANNGYGIGLGGGRAANYPVNGQTQVPTSFLSNNETPDPVPNLNEVGYPISMHADITATMTVQNFTVQPHGGAPLATRLLSHATDTETPPSAAAIVPLAALQSGTTYDVAFSGAVDGVPLSRSWSFTTR